MKKIIFLLFIFLLIFTSQSLAVTVNSPNAILIDATTGRVLYEKNANESTYPASTTKIMTAILTLENCKLGDEVTASYAAVMSVPSGGSTATIQVGETLTVSDLLKALLVTSANEAANILAEHIGGSITNFANMMNTKAKEIGAKNTNFVNANGLHDDAHVSSAYDLALFAKYAFDNFPEFKNIVSTIRFRLPITDKYDKDDRLFLNSNQLIVPNTASGSKNYYYKYANGVKTGYTSQAKNCLVASAEKDGIHLIAVILGAKQDESGTSYRYLDSKELFEYGFDLIVKNQIASKSTVIEVAPVSGAPKESNTVQLALEQDLIVNMDRTDLYNQINPKILINEKIEAPISQGDVLGTATYTVYDKDYVVNLVARESVEKEKNNVLGFIKNIFKTMLILIGICAVLYCVRLYNLAQNRKKRSRKLVGLYNKRWR